MQVTISASGTPNEVREAVSTQIRQARNAHVESAAAIVAVRDEIARHLAEASEDAHVEVRATLDVSVDIHKTTTRAIRAGESLPDGPALDPDAVAASAGTVTRLDGQPMRREADGLVHGEPVTPTTAPATPPRSRK